MISLVLALSCSLLAGQRDRGTSWNQQLSLEVSQAGLSGAWGTLGQCKVWDGVGHSGFI